MDSEEGKEHMDSEEGSWRSFQLQDFCGHTVMCQKHFTHTGFVCD
jgi:hypothetical protein